MMLVCQYPSPGRPQNLSFLRPLMAIRSDHLVVSLIFDQGHYTFLYGHTKHNRECGRKEQTNKHGLGSVPSAREKFLTLLRSSPCICRLSRACICAKLPKKPLGMLTHFLTLVNPASVGQQVLAVVFLTSVLLSSLPCFHLPDWPVLSSAPFCSLLLTVFFWDLTSLFLFRSRGRSRAQALCVDFAPKQTKG